MQMAKTPKQQQKRIIRQLLLFNPVPYEVCGYLILKENSFFTPNKIWDLHLTTTIYQTMDYSQYNIPCPCPEKVSHPLRGIEEVEDVSVLGIQVLCIWCEVRSAEARSCTSAFVCYPPPLLTWAKETSCVHSHSSPFVDLEWYFFTFRWNRLVVKKEVMCRRDGGKGNVQHDRYWIQQQLLKR